MNSVHQLLSEYIAAQRSGNTDPIAFLERAAPGEREELTALIDAYLARAPRRQLDEAAFRDSPSEAVVEALERSMDGEGGLWPALLPRLRAAAGLKRRELVERLAARLGASGREEKVGAYYHEMEQGLLPAAGVSDRVLEALAQITGTTLAALRDAGAAIAPAGRGDSETEGVFARSAVLDASLAQTPTSVPGQAEEAWDEIDELFRGGAG
jgi:hypothetical protein